MEFEFERTAGNYIHFIYLNQKKNTLMTDRSNFVISLELKKRNNYENNGIIGLNLFFNYLT